MPDIATQTAPDLYPCRDEVFYGRGVWPLGEDGEWGVMVEGHGRYALAALLAQQRAAQGPHFHPEEVRAAKPVEKWVRFVETCGHTLDEHAAHTAAAPQDEGPDCDCKWFGLPPCRTDQYAWAWDDAAEGVEGALPVLEVQW